MLRPSHVLAGLSLSALSLLGGTRLFAQSEPSAPTTILHIGEPPSPTSIPIPSSVAPQERARWLLKQLHARQAAKDAQAMSHIVPEQMAMLERQGDYDQMLVAARHLAQVAPSDALAPLYAGRAHFWNGDFERAQMQWRRAQNLDPRLAPQFAPMQAQLQRIRRAYPTLRLRPVRLVPSEIQAHKAALSNRALLLLQHRSFAALEKWCDTLNRSGAVGLDGFSDVSVVCTALATPSTDAQTSWDARQSALKGWNQTAPTSRWPKIVLLRFWTDRAWGERGGAYARDVKPQQWQGMERYLRLAAGAAADLPSSAQNTPVLWAYTLRFSMLAGASPDDVRRMGAEAIRRFSRDRALDCALAFALLPQWAGEPGEWQRFLAARADRIGGEEGDIAYAQMVSKQRDFFTQETFWHTGVSWPRARRGMMALLRRHPDSVSLATWLLLQARLNGDRATQRAMVLQLNDRANRNRWSTPREFAQLRLQVLDPALS